MSEEEPAADAAPEEPTEEAPAEGEATEAAPAEGEDAKADDAAEGEDKKEGEEGADAGGGDAAEGGDGAPKEKKEPPDTGVGERIKKDPHELDFLTELPEKINMASIPRIVECRMVWS